MQPSKLTGERAMDNCVSARNSPLQAVFSARHPDQPCNFEVSMHEVAWSSNLQIMKWWVQLLLIEVSSGAHFFPLTPRVREHVLISARSTIQIKMDIEFFSIGVSGVVVPGGRGLRGLEVHPVHDPVCEHHAGSSGCSHKRSGVKRMIVQWMNYTLFLFLPLARKNKSWRKWFSRYSFQQKSTKL